MSIDFAGINAGLLARAREFLLETFPAGRIEGNEFKLGDIGGSPGRSLSININTGVGSDFATGESWSDLIAVYAAHRRISMGAAAKELGGDRGPTNGSHARPTVAPAPKPEKPAKKAVIPVPDDAPPPPKNARLRRQNKETGEDEWLDVQIVARWAYHTATGGLVGYACRVEFEDGSKDVIPYVYAFDEKKQTNRWQQGAFPRPRPLYGLPAVVNNSGAGILVVEGEKCVDYARALNLKRIATTWPGGCKAVKHADIEPLRGRDVLLWPDHDEPGRAAMADLGGRLLGIGCKVSIIDTQGDDLPDGWDIADSSFDRTQLNAWIRDRLTEIGTGTKPAPPDAARGRPRGGDTSVVSVQGKTEPGALSGGESAAVTWGALNLDLDGKQQPHPNLSNVVAILTRHPKLKGRVWFDVFYNRLYHTLLSDTPLEIEDNLDIELLAWMQSVMRLPKLTKGVVRDALTAVAMRDRRNAPKEWLQSLQWDGNERLPMMFCDGWGVPANSYTMSISQCFMIGLVARLMRPGCQLDYMPVFEGGEGKSKSKALRILGGPWHMEMHHEPGTSAFYEALPGKWLVEFSEMHALAGKDVRRIKGILTTPTDRYREPYGHRASDHPRMCAFVATSNPEDWNESDTGARRFWPLVTGEIGIDYLESNREQLFAEAKARFDRNESWWEFDQETARDEQEARRVSDPWEEAVLYYVKSLRKVALEEVLVTALQLPLIERTMANAKRVARILRSNGYEKKVVREGDRLKKLWMIP